MMQYNLVAFLSLINVYQLEGLKIKDIKLSEEFWQIQGEAAAFLNESTWGICPYG